MGICQKPQSGLCEFACKTEQHIIPVAFTIKVCDSSGKHGNPDPLSSVLQVIFKEVLSEPHSQSLKPGMEPRAGRFGAMGGLGN